MAPEMTAHAMEPFYTTKPEGQGTGLGLPMVHGIARQGGGTLAIESRPGQGTRATIYLPVVEQEEVKTESTSPNVSSTSNAPASSTILLVEDEPMLRRLTARMLHQVGYQVVQAENGAEALVRARELGASLDMVVSDIVMPQLSGIDLVRRLRTERPDLPVLLISGYSEPVNRGRTLPDDVEFLLKPFRSEDLCSVVERSLSRV
jgi:CheY-like chemotaxis protein